jgi:hypothetical protein
MRRYKYRARQYRAYQYRARQEAARMSRDHGYRTGNIAHQQSCD